MIALTFKHGASLSYPQINSCMHIYILQSTQQIGLDTELHLLTRVTAQTVGDQTAPHQLYCKYLVMES